MKQKLLVATTNQGKFDEIANELADLPFDIISLKKINRKIKEPVEDQPTIEGNAILKARYYAEKTGLLTMADDTGLFIKKLKGWPGVKCARIGNNDSERIAKLLTKMKNLKNRSAVFRTVMALHDPKKETLHTTSAAVDGQILKEPVKDKKISYGYNPVFYVNKSKKTFAEMNLDEKNMISHRGRAVNEMKFYLIKQYSFKTYLVPVGIIVKDKKMLMTKRRDFRKEYNNKWEFPGGGVEKGETIIENLKREVKEETGYNIEIVAQLPEIVGETRPKYSYQVFLIPFVCKIKSGKLNPADNEVADTAWLSTKQALKKSLLPLNKKCIQNINNLKMLKKYIN